MLAAKRHEPPCLSLIDTEILDGKMHLTCYFRSWDAYAGLPANIAGLQIFNEALVSEINTRGNLSLETGKLIFHSKNCHIYERQYKLVKELLEPKSSCQQHSENGENNERHLERGTQHIGLFFSELVQLLCNQIMRGLWLSEKFTALKNGKSSNA